MKVKKDLFEKADILAGSYAFRTFKIKYLSCTNYRGTRLKIKDCNFGDAVTIGFDYKFNNIVHQAVAILLSQGYEVKGVINAGNNETIIVCKWTAQKLEKI